MNTFLFFICTIGIGIPILALGFRILELELELRREKSLGVQMTIIANNANKAKTRNQDQLLDDFGIVFNEPEDRYVRVKKGIVHG